MVELSRKRAIWHLNPFFNRFLGENNARIDQGENSVLSKGYSGTECYISQTCKNKTKPLYMAKCGSITTRKVYAHRIALERIEKLFLIDAMTGIVADPVSPGSKVPRLVRFWADTPFAACSCALVDKDLPRSTTIKIELKP